MLPTGDLYDFLEGRLSHPSSTYAKIAEIADAEEKERINRLIGERRTKLGARIGQVITDVKREVYAGSNVEQLYSCVIDWSNEDDIRRLYEERLLQHGYDVLSMLVPTKKADKRAQVQKIAEGMVILKHPCSLAWNVFLEWKDVETIADLGELNLRDYISLFPDDGLAKVLRGFLESEISPFAIPANNGADSNGSEEDTAMSPGDRLALMAEGLEQSSRSVLSHRIMSEYFLYLQEYANAVQTSRKALELLLSEKQLSGLNFQNNADAINDILATSLVQYETPRHHSEGRQIFEEILRRKPGNPSSLIGIGMIFQEEEDYDAAISFLERALKNTPNAKIRSEAAWCRVLKGEFEAGLLELQKSMSEYERSGIQNKDFKAQILHRIGVCQWNLNPGKAARKDRNGAYAKFLASIQTNLNYAPAYTSLGIYYAEYAKDRTRARKCFQKAFELSSSEVEAAERLARSFADQAEWDIVEVIAQRVIESGKVRPPPGSKRKGISWPFAALGVCQLNNQDYPWSIASFQAALRISPEDYHSWVGLGESYHNSGRYIAATKAFQQSQKLEDFLNPADAWFSRFMLANVHRELGDFDEALLKYDEVQALKPGEYAVSIAQLQTQVDSASRSVDLGVFAKAAGTARDAIAVAKTLLKSHSDSFSLWKSIGDACAVFSWAEQYAETVDRALLASVLRFDMQHNMYNALESIDGVGPDATDLLGKSKSPTEACMQAAILAQKRAVHCYTHDLHAQAVAWYNLGWTEHKASACRADSPKRRDQYLRASVKCFKKAIELEAKNADFWNALGIVTTQLNPKVAQHSFVRSLHLDERSARTWTNLGVLYLLQNDTELANTAFTRGQSADPDFAHAWLGQGILALLLGDLKEAQGLFAHAFEIAGSASLAVKRLYAFSTFDSIVSSTKASPLSDLLQPLFALHQLRTQVSSDLVVEHLSALYSERAGSFVESTETLEAVCNAVEAEYEASESPESLARYAQAKADLARAYLASGDYASASTNAELALDLSSDGDSSSPHDAVSHKYRLSAHLTAGLAAHYLNRHDDAIAMFRAALEESDGHPDAIVLLSQVLWAKGGAAERGVAREQLFSCVESHPRHAGAITALAAVALLDGDAEALDAVAPDLHALRTRPDIGERQKLDVAKLIAAIARAGPNGGEEAEKAEAAAAVMLAPSEMHGWSQMAALAEAGDEGPAEMALLTALRSVPPRGGLEADGLARACAGTGRLADAQRAVMVAPWVKDGWDVLE